MSAIRIRLGALAVCAVALAGCTSSHHTAAAAKGVSSAADRAARGAEATAQAEPRRTTAKPAHPAPPGSKPASLDTVCQGISRNLALLTKIATSPSAAELDHSIAQLHDLADSAPTGIGADLEVIADFDQQLLTAVRAGKSPDGIRETPELTRALADETRWTARNCTTT